LGFGYEDLIEVRGTKLTRYGSFSKDNREFLIERPDTPAPWVNYLTNGRYHALLSHTGGGYSFFQSPRDGRITRWRYNSLPVDRPGRYLYLRDRSSGDFWSPTWQPTCSALDRYECRHGLNYTRIVSEYRQVEADLLYFIGQDDLEIWRFKIQNKSDQKKTLDLFASVELCLGHALVDLINQPNDQHFNDVHFNEKSRVLFATKRYWVPSGGVSVKQVNNTWDRCVFMASSLPVSGFDGSRDQFIGRWRSESNPVVVEEGKCRNSAITAGDAVAVLQCPLEIPPGESVEGVILLGVVPKEKEAEDKAAGLVEKYRDLKEVDRQYQYLLDLWQDYLSHYQAETPEPDVDRMVNVWNQYQTQTTFQFSRDASYYHGGLLFGRGYRDSCQDLYGPLKARSDRVRERILEMARFGFKNGSVYHCYYPLTGGGELTGHSDTPLWFPLSVTAYIKETGDWGLLDVEVPYADEGKGPVFEHLMKNIQYVLDHLSTRRLPLFGPGDWNDTLDFMGREGRGESIMSAGVLCYVLGEVIEMLEEKGDGPSAESLKSQRQQIIDSINEHCWDGRWYIRGTRDDGGVIGSSKCEEGQIFLNAQSWMILGGVAPKERALMAMNAAREILNTPKGPKILHPAYTQVDPGIGLATRCVPGKKENGAVFNHAASWAILAELALRRADIAFDYYKKTLPFNPVVDPDRYQVEPYVYAEYVTSPDHPTFGQASHSWLTGSAVWMLRDATEYLLGVRPTYRGLIVDPCVPSGWKQFKVQRKFRGATYAINVSIPEGQSGTVKAIEVDGRSIEGAVIPVAEAGQTVDVKVKVGDKQPTGPIYSR